MATGITESQLDGTDAVEIFGPDEMSETEKFGADGISGAEEICGAGDKCEGELI